MNLREKTTSGDAPEEFRVGYSADFCDEQRQPVFPDIGLIASGRRSPALARVSSEYRAEYSPDQLAGYDVLISLKPKVTAQSLQGISRLCAIGRCGVGYDNVDLEACTEHGIAVFITPGGVVRPVAESIVLLVLALSHNLLSERSAWCARAAGRKARIALGASRASALSAPSDWATLHPKRSVCCGRSTLPAFSPSIPYASSEKASQLGVELVSLDELLRASDYVLVNCPLSPETRGLIGRPQFALMKPDAVLINTARGPIVDEAALIEALQNSKIGGAALDVFEREPLSPTRHWQRWRM